MASSPISLTPHDVRRFQRRALGLDQPHVSVGAALAHHGYIQIDPINVCGRMHDLILRNRVSGYREGDLMRHLHGVDSPLAASNRTAFEHHLPEKGILVALPTDAWPHLLAVMQARSRSAGAWSGRLSPREKELAHRVLEEIGRRGPLGSDAISDERRSRRFWGSATLVKATMQKLFFHGRLLIATRDRGRRLYDLPERVLPASILAATPPPAVETIRWQILLKLRQRRLVLLKKDELAAVEDLVRPIRMGTGPLLHCLKTDESLLDRDDRSEPDVQRPSPLLLAPLDPLIYDRRLTSLVWNYDYTWEVYTPPARRVRGYYALPVLAGLELVGHIDPKADRTQGRLKVISKRVRRGHQTAGAVRELGSFLGLR